MCCVFGCDFSLCYRYPTAVLDAKLCDIQLFLRTCWLPHVKKKVSVASIFVAYLRNNLICYMVGKLREQAAQRETKKNMSMHMSV